jgi:hypothetical protein
LASKLLIFQKYNLSQIIVHYIIFQKIARLFEYQYLLLQLESQNREAAFKESFKQIINLEKNKEEKSF